MAVEHCIGFRAHSINKTVVLTPNELRKVIASWDVESKEIDLQASTNVPTPETQKPAQTGKPVAKQTAVIDEEASKLGIDVSKDVDFARWYRQVLTKSEMLDYYDISGCYIIRPW